MYRQVSGMEWISEQAISHGVAPLLYKCLESKTLEQLGSNKAVRALRNVYLHNALRNTTIWQELSAVLRAFQSAGIPVIVLKGAHLAELVYGLPALRPMSDLDLLVHESDLSQVERCLLGLGYDLTEDRNGAGSVDYARHHHCRPFVKSGAVPVEIHRNLARSDSLMIAPERLWERARDAVIAGVPAKVLSPDDFLLHLCLHAAHNHRFKVPLLYFCDIAASIERYRHEIDWQDIATVAEEWGVSRLVYVTFLLVEEILGSEVESTKLDLFRHEAADREIVATLREFLLAPQEELPSAYQEFGEHERLRDRARTLMRSLFPPRTQMRQIYSVPVSMKGLSFYYLFRPLELLVHRRRFLFELIFRSERLRPALDREQKRLRIHHWLEGCVGRGIHASQERYNKRTD